MEERAPPRVVGVLYADPWSVFTWGLQPVVRRVEEVYGGQVRVEARMAGAFDDLARFQAETHLDGPALQRWLSDATRRTGNPVDPEFLLKGRVTSTYPACLAVLAAQRMDTGRADRFLRRLMEYLLIRAVPADDAVLKQCARDVGLDPETLMRTWRDAETRASLERAHAEMQERHASFEDIDWQAGPGVRARVEEEFRAARHEDAIDRLAPGLTKHRPTGVAEYVHRHPDLIPVREVAEVFGWSDGEAEHELEALWRRGEVERWSYGGAAFWTQPHRSGRPRPPE